MLRTLQAVGQWMFFFCGIALLSGFVFIKWHVAADQVSLLLRSLVLPLLGSGMVYAGTSLYHSLTKEGEISWLLLLSISVPLIALFAIFLYMNFGLPILQQ